MKRKGYTSKVSKICKLGCIQWPNFARPLAQKFASLNWWTIRTSSKLSLRFRIAIIKGLQTWAWIELSWQSWTTHNESTSRITLCTPNFWASFKPNSIPHNSAIVIEHKSRLALNPFKNWPWWYHDLLLLTSNFYYVFSLVTHVLKN